MSEAIVIALISSIIPLLGTVITVLWSAGRTDEKVRTGQAVMQSKVEELTREVREHNNFARRMPVVEEQIKVINHRLEDLENDGR